MKNIPMVTVICLCYNHDKYIVECLNSVIYNQSYTNIQLIIVDDCSSDNSKIVIENWIENYPTAIFIHNPINIGGTKSFNNALKLAKGDYIIDLAADDVLKENCIKKQLEKFNSSTFSNLGVVYGNAELINEKSCFLSNYFEVNSNNQVLKKRITGNVYESILSGGDSICSVSSMIKKSVYDDLNGYDENLSYEDLDFWIRASRKYDFDFIDEILVSKRVLPNSLGSQFFKKNNSINYSTYKIYTKAFKLNNKKTEDLALLKRVHYEIILNLKTHNFLLVIKLFCLELKLRFRKL